MTRKMIRVKETLFYYDGRDAYLVKGVNPRDLNAFRVGQADLRVLLLGADNDEWYLTDAEFDAGAPLALQSQNESLASSGYLPDAGFLLLAYPADAHDPLSAVWR